MTLEAQHQHRRGVAGTDEAEAVGEVDPQAVDGADLAVAEREELAVSDALIDDVGESELVGVMLFDDVSLDDAVDDGELVTALEGVSVFV